MNTPWGTSDSKTTLARGISFVTTPSHGGFMISVRQARKLLSNAALNRGERYGSYLAYEEDCDAFIPLLELPVSMLEKLGGIQTEEKLISSLSAWHADYLIERGIQPTVEGLKFFNENRQHDRMRQDKSPDLIVAAWGDWAEWVPAGKVGLQTADGKRYLVPSSNYQTRNLNLLSQLLDVQEAQ